MGVGGGVGGVVHNSALQNSFSDGLSKYLNEGYFALNSESKNINEIINTLVCFQGDINSIPVRPG